MQPAIVDRGQSKASAANQRLNTDTVRSFLVQIGRVPLLTREEEIFHSQRVKQLTQLLQIKEDLTNKFDSEPSHFPHGLRQQKCQNLNCKKPLIKERWPDKK